jgi:hypothetical protein
MFSHYYSLSGFFSLYWYRKINASGFVALSCKFPTRTSYLSTRDTQPGEKKKKKKNKCPDHHRSYPKRAKAACIPGCDPRKGQWNFTCASPKIALWRRSLAVFGHNAWLPEQHPASRAHRLSPPRNLFEAENSGTVPEAHNRASWEAEQRSAGKTASLWLFEK